MKHTISFDILTVTFDDPAGLATTVRSVLSQDYPRFRLFIQDASTSPRLDQINSLLLSPRVYYCSEPDSGVYDGMNRLMSHVESDWFLFLNGGDSLYDTRSLSRAAQKLQTIRLSGQLAIACFSYFNEEHSLVRKPRSPSFLPVISAGYMPTSHQSMFFSRKVSAHFRYDLGYRVSSDHAFFWTLIANGADCFTFDEITSSFAPPGLSRRFLFSSCADVYRSMINIQGFPRSLAIPALGWRFFVSLLHLLFGRFRSLFSMDFLTNQ